MGCNCRAAEMQHLQQLVMQRHALRMHHQQGCAPDMLVDSDALPLSSGECLRWWDCGSGALLAAGCLCAKSHPEQC